MIEISRVEDRDCKRCANYKQYVDRDRERGTSIIHACSKWNCKFEPKESADENTKTEVDI